MNTIKQKLFGWLSNRVLDLTPNLDDPIEKQVEKYAQGLCKVMVVSANAAREKFPNKKFYSDYAALALSMRPRWKLIEDNAYGSYTFVFSGNNLSKEIKITKNDSTASILPKICEYELTDDLNSAPEVQRSTLIRLGIDVINSYFNK